MKKFCVRFLSLLIILCMFSGCTLSINTQDETANAAASANDTARPMDPATVNQPTAEPAPEPTTTPEPIPEPTHEPTEEPMTIENAEGIIALEANLTSAILATDGSFAHFTIYSIDPESGRQYALSSLDVPMADSDGNVYEFPVNPHYSSLRDWFSSDYDMFAISACDFARGSRDAGWINSDGSFTNVTELLGMQAQSEFESAKHFYAVGFSADGYFVFFDNEEPLAPVFYSIPVNNLSTAALEQRNAIEDSLPSFDSYYLCFNDWIDTTRCLVDYLYDGRIAEKTESLIFDTTTGETTPYVPGDGRYSWCGVASPDGSTAAFLSSPKGGTEQPALYTVSLAGGEPIRNPASFVFSPDGDYSRRPPFVLYPQLGTTCVTLLEWR